jgi:hypothetical protein
MSTRDFDEAYYRKRYPDVAEAIDNDRFPSAHAHYQRFGRIEGRFPTRAAEDEAALDIKVGKHVLVNGAALLKKRLALPHTYVVVGASRGGTSAIAFAMYHQGINMGVENTVNYEDPILMKAIKPNAFDGPKVRARIAQQNTQNAIWGFKVPDAAFHMLRLEKLLRNPIYISIYRNPVSVARSVLSRTKVHDQTSQGMSRALSHSSVFYSKVAAALPKLKSPVLCIEYEQMLLNTENTLTEIFDALGQELVTPDLLFDHISKPGYKNVSLGKVL